MLQIKNLNVKYGANHTVVENFHLSVKKGEIISIVGESGCGKSTFVQILMQIIKPTKGEILYHKDNILTFSEKKKWENYQNIQMVFQDPLASFHPKKKVIDILTEPLMNYKRLKRKNREEKAKELLELVDLPESLLYRYPHSMSGSNLR